MIGIVDWARDLLVSRGALVETEEAGALRALLPAELADALESREWLSLRFGADAGANDETEWLDRLSRLLPPDARVVSARLRRSVLAPPVDANHALDRGLALQNGISGVLSINWSDETYRKMSTSLTVIGKKGKIICDATEIKIYLKEENKREHLEKGWTIRSIAEYAIPVNYYLRGEEYSAQIDNFIDCIKSGKQSTINTFEQAQYTDRVIEMILSEAKRA